MSTFRQSTSPRLLEEEPTNRSSPVLCLMLGCESQIGVAQTRPARPRSKSLTAPSFSMMLATVVARNQFSWSGLVAMFRGRCPSLRPCSRAADSPSTSPESILAYFGSFTSSRVEWARRNVNIMNRAQCLCQPANLLARFAPRLRR